MMTDPRTENEIQYHWPLGIVKQAVMKLESFMTDIQEIKEDPDVDDNSRQTLETISETSGLMLAHLVNMIREECGEEDFLNEDIAMDSIDEYPGDDSADIMDQRIN